MRFLTVCTLSMLLGAALGVCAGDAPLKMSFDEMRRNSYMPGKADAIQNGRIIYEVKGLKVPSSFLMLRGNREGQLRIDIVTAEGLFTACYNGKEYWGYSKESGKVQLSEDDVADMNIDVPFLPFPFLTNSGYGDLTYAGSGVFRESECSLYELPPPQGEEMKLTIWIDNATKRVCMITEEDATGGFGTSLRNYRDFGGIELPTRLNLGSTDDVAVMSLVSAEWNVKFADGIFQESSDLANDPRLAELQQWLAKVDQRKERKIAEYNAAEQAKFEAAKKTIEKRDAAVDAYRDKKTIAYLKKEIASLTERLNKELPRLAKLKATAEQDAANLEQSERDYARNRYVYRQTWSYRGWGNRWSGHWGGRWRGRGRRRRNNELRFKNQNNRRLADYSQWEYGKTEKEVAVLQLQLKEAQAYLDELLKKTGAAPAPAEKTKDAPNAAPAESAEAAPKAPAKDNR